MEEQETYRKLLERSGLSSPDILLVSNMLFSNILGEVSRT